MTNKIEEQAKRLFGEPVERYTSYDIMMSIVGHKLKPSADGTWIKLEDHERIVNEWKTRYDQRKTLQFVEAYGGNPQNFAKEFMLQPNPDVIRGKLADGCVTSGIVVVRHPGTVLYDIYLKGMEQEITKLAHWIDYPVADLTRVCVGLDPIKEPLAVKLAMHFDTSANHWLKMQEIWDKRMGHNNE